MVLRSRATDLHHLHLQAAAPSLTGNSGSRPLPLPLPQRGILHEYAERLVAFEYSTSSPGAGSHAHVKPHTLLFIGGLNDGLGTVSYVADIVAALEGTEWSLFSPILSSSYAGWGMGGLKQDVYEIARCVEYIREYKRQRRSASTLDSGWGDTDTDTETKIVVMGHSTGCQDVLQYLSAGNPQHRDSESDTTTVAPAQDRGARASVGIPRPQIDGAIIQAPVSDREAIQWVLRTGNKRHTADELQKFYTEAIRRAQKHTFEEYRSLDTVVPLPATASLGFASSTPISSRRFLSLASPASPQDPGEDDLFSSDLTDGRLMDTFGAIHRRGVLRSKLLVLYSGQDETVPPFVDKVRLLRRWQRATDAERSYWHEQSGVIPGATHTMAGPGQVEARRILIRKTMRFLSDVEKHNGPREESRSN
ncbi:hypothetical protein BJY00DRAFT_297433 [Aspergillus carlsbadensis]|nr:hypothetical protein BJY00DRAFT_297433 [Aspergillus carlsbadensis]